MKCFVMITILFSILACIFAHPSGGVVEYRTASLQTWPVYALPYPQLPFTQPTQLAVGGEQISENQFFLNPTKEMSEQQISHYTPNIFPLTYAPLQYYSNQLVGLVPAIDRPIPSLAASQKPLSRKRKPAPEPTTKRPQINPTFRAGSFEKLVDARKNDQKEKSVIQDLQFLSAIQQPNKKFIIEKIIPVPGTRLFQLTTFENNNKLVSQQIQQPKKLQLNSKTSEKIIESLNSSDDDQIEDTTVKIEVTGHTAADQPVPNIPVGAFFTPYFGEPTNSLANNNGVGQATLILEPQAKSIVGNGGTAISAPVSRAILKKGISTRVYFRPQSVAIAGAGGKAHAQADLILDYVNRK